MSALIHRLQRGELAFKIARSEMDDITGRFRSMTHVMMLVILTVTAGASSLFFALIGSKTFALAAAGVSVVLGLLSVFRLMRD
jgi:hypothetical protein